MLKVTLCHTFNLCYYVLGVGITHGIYAVHSVTTLNNNSLAVSYNILATDRNQCSAVSIVTMLQGSMTKESWFNSWQRQAITPFHRGYGLVLGHSATCSVGTAVTTTRA
jgi:hypothetical protein